MTDLKFTCPYCKQHLEAPPEVFGQTVECPSCKKQITLQQYVSCGNETSSRQPAKVNAGLADKYLTAEEQEVSRTGREPNARHCGLGLVGLGALLIAMAAFLASRGLKDNGSLYAGILGAWGGTVMILTGICSIVTGRGATRLPKTAKVLIWVVSLPVATAILVGVAIKSK